MIDLHIHTFHSDGILSPLEILKKADKKNLKYISITDHDSISAYEELKKIKIKDFYKGEIILGCEIKFLFKGTQMELLCYGYDFKKLNKSKYVHKKFYHKMKKASLKNCLKNAKKLGFVYDFVKYNPNEKSERTFYFELVRHKENLKILKKHNINHPGNFFRKFIANPASSIYFDSSKYVLTLKDAAKLIHSCKGLAVLAHPFGVYNIKNPKPVIEEIISTGLIDGLECMHCDMTIENTNYLLKLCKKYDLVSTGGSDFHGYEGQSFAKSYHGKLDIPLSLISEFLKKVNKTKFL